VSSKWNLTRIYYPYSGANYLGWPSEGPYSYEAVKRCVNPGND